MEFYELKYFSAAAETGSIQQASRKLKISAPSISKAISRLEDEFGKNLFVPDGRGIKLTEHGQLLAKEILSLTQWEQSIRQKISGKEAPLKVVISGRGVLLTQYGNKWVKRISKAYPKSMIDLRTHTDDEARKSLLELESDVIISTTDYGAPLKSIKVGSFKMATVVGLNHPLAKGGGSVPIEKVLEHGHVSTENYMFSNMKPGLSQDGWHDDLFPRRIQYVTRSIWVYQDLLEEGLAIGYVPDFLIKKWKVKKLSIRGCDLKCEMDVFLSYLPDRTPSWLQALL